MNKLIIVFSLFFLSLSPLMADEYPPESWTIDIKEAVEEAQRTGKDILLNFTGSDWCSWCHKLRDEVFSTQEFKDYADENLILVFLDFPNGIDQSEKTIEQNQTLARVLGVAGFPTIWLLDSTLAPILKTGYRPGGGKEYVRHLREDRPVTDEETQDRFRKIVEGAVEPYL